jgi:hypothetical protein
MMGYSSIIGPFEFLDRDRRVGRPWVRSTNSVSWVLGFGKYRSLTLVPPVEPLNCPFEAAFRNPFEAIEGMQGSRFIGQAGKCEHLEHDLGFRGMDEALAGDFLRRDAGFEEDEAQAFLVRVENGLQQKVVFGIAGVRGGAIVLGVRRE